MFLVQNISTFSDLALCMLFYTLCLSLYSTLYCLCLLSFLCVCHLLSIRLVVAVFCSFFISFSVFDWWHSLSFLYIACVYRYRPTCFHVLSLYSVLFLLLLFLYARSLLWFVCFYVFRGLPYFLGVRFKF